MRIPSVPIVDLMTFEGLFSSLPSLISPSPLSTAPSHSPLRFIHDFAKICVMGDQSSGKSSVLEALAGIPFPRGSGLVTRCPIRLSMKRSSQGSRWSAVAHASNEPAASHAASSPDQLTKVSNSLSSHVECYTG